MAFTVSSLVQITVYIRNQYEKNYYWAKIAVIHVPYLILLSVSTNLQVIDADVELEKYVTNSYEKSNLFVDEIN